MMAASLSVDSSRAATMMQFLFLQGTDPEQPVAFEVTALQDGKRFSSRHVRGTQGGRVVLDANATFAFALPAPQHGDLSMAQESVPEALPEMPEVPWEWEEGLRRLGGYSLREKPCIAFRVPDIDAQVNPESAEFRVRFWLKAKHELPVGAAMHASAFAYLSDWWLNFSSLGAHVRDLTDGERLYISSLNHCVWFHRPFPADQWMHFDSRSPWADGGRGLSLASVHDQQGRRVATVTQECLMAYA
jgi:acyl-CoA thioesterase II